MKSIFKESNCIAIMLILISSASTLVLGGIIWLEDHNHYRAIADAIISGEKLGGFTLAPAPNFIPLLMNLIVRLVGPGDYAYSHALFLFLFSTSFYVSMYIFLKTFTNWKNTSCALFLMVTALLSIFVYWLPPIKFATHFPLPFSHAASTISILIFTSALQTIFTTGLKPWTIFYLTASIFLGILEGPLFMYVSAIISIIFPFINRSPFTRRSRILTPLFTIFLLLLLLLVGGYLQSINIPGLPVRIDTQTGSFSQFLQNIQLGAGIVSEHFVYFSLVLLLPFAFGLWALYILLRNILPLGFRAKAPQISDVDRMLILLCLIYGFYILAALLRNANVTMYEARYLHLAPAVIVVGLLSSVMRLSIWPFVARALTFDWFAQTKFRERVTIVCLLVFAGVGAAVLIPAQRGLNVLTTERHPCMRQVIDHDGLILSHSSFAFSFPNFSPTVAVTPKLEVISWVTNMENLVNRDRWGSESVLYFGTELDPQVVSMLDSWGISLESTSCPTFDSLAPVNQGMKLIKLAPADKVFEFINRNITSQAYQFWRGRIDYIQANLESEYHWSENGYNPTGPLKFATFNFSLPKGLYEYQIDYLLEGSCPAAHAVVPQGTVSAHHDVALNQDKARMVIPFEVSDPMHPFASYLRQPPGIWINVDTQNYDCHFTLNGLRLVPKD